MIEFFTQMLRLPVVIVVSGIDALSEMMHRVQGDFDKGVASLSNSISTPASDGTDSLGSNESPEKSDLRAEEASAAFGPSMHTEATPFGTATRNVSLDQKSESFSIPKEKRPMRDNDLSGKDTLKLVRYKVLFVKRQYEHAFPENEELVSDDTTGEGFTSWKIAEFIQQLDPNNKAEHKEYKVSGKLAKYLEDKGKKDKVTYVQNGMLRGLPPDDKKYLRLFYEVLERYPREEAKEKIEVLEEIRDAIGSV